MISKNSLERVTSSLKEPGNQIKVKAKAPPPLPPTTTSNLILHANENEKQSNTEVPLDKDSVYKNKENKEPNVGGHTKRPAPKPPVLNSSSEKSKTESKEPDVDNLKKDNDTLGSVNIVKSVSKESIEQEITLQEEYYDANSSNEVSKNSDDNFQVSNTVTIENNSLGFNSCKAIGEVTVSADHSTIIDSNIEPEDKNMDMSHISIVSIDNDKNVTIKTGEYLDHFDDLEKTNVNDNTSSKASSTDYRALNAGPPGKDVIIVASDYSIIDYNNLTRSPTSSPKVFTSSFSRNLTHENEIDDHLSLKTISSDSSNSGKRIKVNLNLVAEREETEYESISNRLEVKSKEQESKAVNKSHNQPDVVPDIVSNGSYSKYDHSHSKIIQRDSSDAGSCASFASLNSDKENRSEPPKEFEAQVQLRKRRIDKVINY